MDDGEPQQRGGEEAVVVDLESKEASVEPAAVGLKSKDASVEAAAGGDAQETAPQKEAGGGEQVAEAVPPPSMTEADPQQEEAGGERQKQEQEGSCDAAGDKGEQKREEEADVEMIEPQEERRELPSEEVDSTEDAREKIPKDAAVLGSSAADTTLNVVTSAENKVFTAFTDGGFQHLAAAVRSAVGIKTGRYFYEVQIVEIRRSADMMPKQKLRLSCCLGFTTAGSTLFLGSGAENVGFDSDGHYVSAGEWSNRTLYERFEPYSAVYGVLLNLDPKSPFANTVSLFCNGARICKPQPLPESLKGKALYPTVNYKGMTLHINLGNHSMAPLPFSCRMVQDAAAEDVDISVPSPPSDSDKSEVLLPVGLPDEGTFEWLDSFLEENPNYTELSHRALLEWGLKSGLHQQKGSQWNSCNDRPLMDFGIREFDEHTLQETILSLAPLMKRNFIVMEVKKNLLADERKKSLTKFPSGDFKKTALVVMGEPPDAFKARPKKSAEGAEQEKERDAAVKEDEAMPEKAEERQPQEAGESREQDKTAWFRKAALQDLSTKTLGKCFSSFTIPEKEEGFDELKYAWQPAPKAAEYLTAWVAERKLTQKIEDLQPGASFKEQLSEWTRVLQEWRRRQSDSKDDDQGGRDASRRRTGDKRQREEDDRRDDDENKEWERQKWQRQQRWGDQDQNQNQNGGGADKAAEGVEAKEVDEAKEKESNEKETSKEGAAKEEPEKPDFDSIDPLQVEDLNDVGTGEPLFAAFTWEDWIMLSLRFELHLLVHSYKTDVNDPERPSFHESHLSYYYYKYFKKQLNIKSFGVETNQELLALVKDTIEVSKNSILDLQLSEDAPLDIFVRLTEDHRRERKHRVDMGEEAAELHLQQPPPSQQQQRFGQQAWGSRGSQQDMGKGRDAYRGGGGRPGDYSRGVPPQASYGAPYGGRDDGTRHDARGGRDQYRASGSRENRSNTSGSYGGCGGGYGGGRDGGHSQRDSGYSREGGYGRRDGFGGGGGGGGRDGRGQQATRHRSPPAPPAASRASSASGASAYAGSGPKRSYTPPTSSGGGGYSSQSQSYKQSRTSYGSGGPPPSSRGGGGSYGSSGGFRR